MQYGQRFIGVDLNPEYVEIAEQRLLAEWRRLREGRPVKPVKSKPATTAKPWWEPK
jgi:DNA modification methylase